MSYDTWKLDYTDRPEIGTEEIDIDHLFESIYEDLELEMSLTECMRDEAIPELIILDDDIPDELERYITKLVEDNNWHSVEGAMKDLRRLYTR